MARIVQNNKDFKVIALESKELEYLHFGNICFKCNRKILKDEEAYYIAVLHDIVDKECYEKWLERAENYPEDRNIENFNMGWVIGRLNSVDIYL